MLDAKPGRLKELMEHDRMTARGEDVAEFLSSDERMGSFLGAMAEEPLTSSEATRMLWASKATITRSARLGKLPAVQPHSSQAQAMCGRATNRKTTADPRSA